MKFNLTTLVFLVVSLEAVVGRHNGTGPTGPVLPWRTRDHLCLDHNSMHKNCTQEEVDGGLCNLNGCIHKPLFSPFLSLDAVGGIAIMIGCIFAVAGGIGGGGLFVPLLILVESFDVHEAVPLSKAMILAAAIVSFTSNVRKRNPHADRPLIDLDCAIFLVPMTLAGTVPGTILNVVFPTWLIGLLLIIVLGATTYRTVQKGVKTLKKERADAAHMKAKATSIYASESGDSVELIGAEEAVLDGDEVDDEEEVEGSADVDEEKTEDIITAEDEANRKLIESIQANERKFSLKKFFAMWGIWAVLGVSAIIRGGHGFSMLGIDPCSDNGWVFYTFAVLPVLFCTIVCMLYGRYLANRYELKQKIGYPFADGDFKWTRRSTLVYPWVAMVGGIFAGLLGIGGGMVIGPILLELGGHPQVSSAVSAFTILFTASATTFQFLLLGVLEYDYALYYSIICAIAAVIGQKAVGAIIKKYKKVSIIVFCLAGVMGVSSVLIGGIDIFQTIDDLNKNRSMGFQAQKLCMH
eukprot:CAMPEP_0113874728 /NCGR_PEP_ID=MMETSP0780_2-20120614/4503_1 /TAXON_ID=652834 /ORGANISM="Palpitomonas bilix" /LENGTH=521 /DNA_ID=CAMNT_0000860549 /DNA_START=58 /DNA_END=1623 /DNA_ORIENTATION=+ /assembly_acc=CAM_ASM_000599